MGVVLPFGAILLASKTADAPHPIDVVMGILMMAIALVGAPAIRHWFKALVLRQKQAAAFADHSGLQLTWVPEAAEPGIAAPMPVAPPAESDSLPAAPSTAPPIQPSTVAPKDKITALGCITGVLGLVAWYALWMTLYPFVGLLIFHLVGEGAETWNNWIGIVTLLYGAGFLAGGIANFHLLPRRTVALIAVAYLLVIALGWLGANSSWAKGAGERLRQAQREHYDFKPPNLTP